MNKVLGLSMALGALVLVACAQPQATTAPVGGGADTPKFGGVLNLVGDDLTGWDMGYTGQSSINVRFHGFVYDGLLAFKKGPDTEYVSQTLQPELAERWEVAADARTYTYYLRKGVKFSNTPPVNGREFTAADVKWNLEYYSRSGEFKDKKLPPSQTASLYEGIEAVETPDNYTVRVRFKEPFVPFVNYSASQWMPMGAHEIYDAEGNLTKTLIGTGPYTYDEANSQRGTRWVLAKNPTYWDAPRPYLDGIRRLVILDASTQQAAFQVKQVDLLERLEDYEQIQTIKNTNLDAVRFEPLSPLPQLLFISQARGAPLTDIRVRRAISLAMDRDEHDKVLSGGKGAWLLSGSYPGLFTDAEAHAMLKYDPEQSKRLLAEAGYGSGLKLEYLAFAPPGIAQQLIQAQLKKVGIEMTFSQPPREQGRQRLYVGDYDLFYPGGVAIAGDDFDIFQYSFHSSSLQNWSQVKDPELDKLVTTQRREPDVQKRREAQRAVVKRINEMAWNPGYSFRLAVDFWHPYVKNYRPHYTIGEAQAFIWLDK